MSQNDSLAQPPTPSLDIIEVVVSPISIYVVFVHLNMLWEIPNIISPHNQPPPQPSDASKLFKDP